MKKTLAMLLSLMMVIGLFAGVTAVADSTEPTTISILGYERNISENTKFSEGEKQEVWNALEKMLADTEVRLNVDYLADRENLNALADKVVYTGPVDAYFGYRLGALQYRSVRFETEVLDTDNYQGNAVVNYTDAETPYTRIIEHKHFAFGTQPKTVISREYSTEWHQGDEPYYPVNDEKNGALYAKYKALADAETKVIFGGRLGEYKYYDMDKVIEAALDAAARELG